MVNEGAIAKVAVYRVEGAGLSEQADGCQPAREDAAKKSQGICAGCHGQGCWRLMLCSYHADYGREPPGDEIAAVAESSRL
jgi:hypothetical protein